MTTQTSKKPSGIDQGFKIDFLGIKINLYLGLRLNVNGAMFSIIPPLQFSLSEENDPDTEAWEVGKILLPDNKKKPFGVILLEEEKETLSKKMLLILEFLSSSKDIEGVNLKTDEIVFEVIESDEDNAQRKIFLYEL